MPRDPNSSLYPAPGQTDEGSWHQPTPGRSWSVAALTLATIATFIPLIPGAIGMLLARRASNQGDPLGRTAFVLCGIAMAVGVIVIVLVAGSDLESAGGW